MLRVVVCCLVMGLMTGGCTWFRSSTKKPETRGPLATNAGTSAETNTPPRMIVTPDTAPTGKVVRVNETARFVVLNFPIGSVPTVGQRLYIYRQGLKVGEIKVTGPQEEDNTVADIVNGEAQPGDEIRTK